MRRRSVLLLGSAAVAAGIVLAIWRPWGTRRDVPPPLPLAAVLKQQQYVEVPLGRAKNGYLYVTGQAQGQPLLLYLDSGNTDNQLDDAVAVRFKLPRRRAEVGIIVAKETAPPDLVVLEALSLSGLQARIEASVSSLDSANRIRKANGEPPYDGILGAPFLKEKAAVIDYGSVQLFLQDGAHQPVPGAAAERASLLRNSGYVELPLTLRASGLPDVTADLNGEPALFVVDTGAQLTSLDQMLADRLKLPQQDVPGQTMGLLDGSQIPLRFASVERLDLGGVSIAIGTAGLMPMAKLNAWRKEQGYPPWAGLLGAEVLHSLGAVIDFEGSKLFLLDPRHKRG
ncbi:MAG TPA: aspartyl protease family protein [Gemmataceae bacterium]|nr:aspartyl protease family protein [Gemmataceae bacterium]